MAKTMSDRDYATPFSMLHAAMLLDQKSRLEKFDQAIRQIVKTKDYVVDLGTGSGVLAIMAAKAGADKVTAIDINRESIAYARHAARLNKVHDRIEFIEGHFSEFIPAERADVVICEMLSSILLIEQQVPASFHAVENILKKDGTIIPQSVTIYTVPVESPVMFNRFTFDKLKFPKVAQTVSSEVARDLSDIQVLSKVDLTKTKIESDIDETLEYRILSDGEIHGLVGLFEADLYNDIKLNMHDGWKQLFLPLTKPIRVETGDEFKVRVSYTPGQYDSLEIELF